jgi:Ferritin-like domain
MSRFRCECGFVARLTRGQLLRRGAVGGSVVLAGGGLLAWSPATAGSAPSQSLDRKIFQFALQLEYLQAAFYAAAVDAGALRGEVLSFAETVGGHEQEHVDFLRRALGSAAGEKPRFEFGRAMRNERTFLDAAMLLENTGVAAYNGQAANLTKRSLAAAAEIVSVEGRHAAWASSLAGRPPAPRAADPGATAAAVAAIVKKTGFVR